MNRDETIALFERCEAARAAAKQAALDEGKEEDEARVIGHEAAKAIWNGWAEELLAERAAMEADGLWAMEKKPLGPIEPQNDKTCSWMAEAKVDFSCIHFLVMGAEGTEIETGELNKESLSENMPVKLIFVEDSIVGFRGFKFPSEADFTSTTFSGNADFRRVIFTSGANFKEAMFKGYVSYENGAFSGYTSFHRATFSDDAEFSSTIFRLKTQSLH